MEKTWFCCKVFIAFNKDNSGCEGASRYAGYTHDLPDNIGYFLSCGMPGKVEGERYKIAPHIVQEMMQHVPQIEGRVQWMVFKRWDQLREQDETEVVIIYAEPDVLSGLFMLANFDYVDPNGVKTPMC